MARAQATDFIQSFRYQVVADPGAPAGEIFDPQAGFSSVTIPEMNVEPAEYKEGVYNFPRKFPGAPTVTNSTFSRGVVRNDSLFYDWIQAAAKGREYRTDIEIRVFHREDFGENEAADRGTPSKIVRMFNCFASRVKPVGDLDATTSDISIQEIDVECEDFELT